MADVIAITGLEFMACHGVYESEHHNAQPFIVDIEVEVDTRRAGQSDSLSATISYADLAADARAVVLDGERADLIETLAEKIAERVLVRDPLAVTVTVHKPGAAVPEIFTDAYVRITRHNPLAQRPTEPQRVVSALGGNIGDVEETFKAAIEDICALEGVRLLAFSPFLCTKPVLADGQDPQDDYTNGVALVETTLSPLELLEALQGIENKHGRVRTERWGARTLDLDIIDYAGVEADHVRLTLPHPRAAERLFVLEPWVKIEPHATLAGAPISELIRQLKDGE
ncbi:MAG: 2-amino-4-hydroxy-6-hydroxymethyldihydropteridine diphosphokinase [Actinomycetaceae bacterium]|nr:2-amino-4-hydroxy-6-hydroxymethyldihydropteridine diphosphokinase [Actinomycetaceae bacterium]